MHGIYMQIRMQIVLISEQRTQHVFFSLFILYTSFVKKNWFYAIWLYIGSQFRCASISSNRCRLFLVRQRDKYLSTKLLQSVYVICRKWPYLNKNSNAPSVSRKFCSNLGMQPLPRLFEVAIFLHAYIKNVEIPLTLRKLKPEPGPRGCNIF